MSVSESRPVDSVTQLSQQVESFQHNLATQALFFAISFISQLFCGFCLDFTRWRITNLALEFDELEKLVNGKQINFEQFNAIRKLFDRAINQIDRQLGTDPSNVAKLALREKIENLATNIITRIVPELPIDPLKDEDTVALLAECLENLDFDCHGSKLLCGIGKSRDIPVNMFLNMPFSYPQRFPTMLALDVGMYPGLAQIAGKKEEMLPDERSDFCKSKVSEYFSSEEGRPVLNAILATVEENKKYQRVSIVEETSSTV